MRIVLFGDGDKDSRFYSWLLTEEIVGTTCGEVSRDRIAALRPDIGLSIYYRHIFKPEIISLFPQGIINLHTAYLPYNRGAYPNVWSIVDQTPAGVTLHYIDEGIDTGPIIAQEYVPVTAFDTGETLNNRLTDAAFELFKQTWPKISDGTIKHGTYHNVADVEKIDEIHLDETYVARDLINVLRARTYPPYDGAYFIDNGEKIYMELNLRKEDDE